MKMWQDKNDKIHELALLKAQAKITLDQTAIDASIREVESIHQHDSQIKGSTFVENTRALVSRIMPMRSMQDGNALFPSCCTSQKFEQRLIVKLVQQNFRLKLISTPNKRNSCSQVLHLI